MEAGRAGEVQGGGRLQAPPRTGKGPTATASACDLRRPNSRGNAHRLIFACRRLLSNVALAIEKDAVSLPARRHHRPERPPAAAQMPQVVRRGYRCRSFRSAWRHCFRIVLHPCMHALRKKRVEHCIVYRGLYSIVALAIEKDAVSLHCGRRNARNCRGRNRPAGIRAKGDARGNRKAGERGNTREACTPFSVHGQYKREILQILTVSRGQ